ncbi:hypothetical protein UlMin_030177 [Ulmus minor]
MSCFKIPVSICDDIERVCVSFWWGDSKNGKRMHSSKWDNLCRPKSESGLRVLKARYFPSCLVLEAGLGTSLSFIWRSLIWERELGLKGVKRRIGNGLNTSIYKSRWIPVPYLFQVVSPRVLALNAIVASLLDEHGR